MLGALGTIVAMATLLASAAAYAEGEAWQCQGGMSWYDSGKILLELTIDETGMSGDVIASGTSQRAKYMVQGLNRRWDFGIAEDWTYDYAIVIEPDGSAFYLDFSRSEPGETVKSSQRYICRQK